MPRVAKKSSGKILDITKTPNIYAIPSPPGLASPLLPPPLAHVCLLCHCHVGPTVFTQTHQYKGPKEWPRCRLAPCLSHWNIPRRLFSTSHAAQQLAIVNYFKMTRTNWNKWSNASKKPFSLGEQVHCNISSFQGDRISVFEIFTGICWIRISLRFVILLMLNAKC